MPFENAVPVIGTTDVSGTVRYFEQTLGFEQEWTWGEPPVYAEIAEELAEQPWGVRQYTVREPNGYLLKISESD
jgi:hypothetical protein